MNESQVTYRRLSEETGRLTLRVEMWTPEPEHPEYVFDFLQEAEGWRRDQIFDVELDETNLDSDDEGNRFVSYVVEINPTKEER